MAPHITATSMPQATICMYTCYPYTYKASLSLKPWNLQSLAFIKTIVPAALSLLKPRKLLLVAALTVLVSRRTFLSNFPLLFSRCCTILWRLHTITVARVITCVIIKHSPHPTNRIHQIIPCNYGLLIHSQICFTLLLHPFNLHHPPLWFLVSIHSYNICHVFTY